MGKKWNSAKSSDFVFELPEGDMKSSQFEVTDGVIKKINAGSFANVVGLQPIPKTGVHSFSVKVISSLSGGSIIYGLCTSEVKD